MPHAPAQAATPGARQTALARLLSATPGAGWRARCAFALFVTLLHLALVAPMLARHHADPSVFIVAGDRFVAAGQTASPIIVRPHSDGYDGQFYYRLALAPFLAKAQAFGVTLDHPAWRTQRILLPVLVRLVAGFNAARVPWAFLLVNLAGLFAIGWLATFIAQARRMPWIVPAAIALWPGLLIALTHDTTEILATALLLAGVAAWLARRWALCAAMLALASLTRETVVLLAAGMLLSRVVRLLRPAAAPRPWAAAAWALAALLPFLAWRQIVATLWLDTPQAHGVAHNIGWPLLGIAQAFLANLFNHAVGAARAPPTALLRLTSLVGMVMILWAARQAARAALLARGVAGASGLALGWLALLALMLLLTAGGPWVEPTSFFRAFTEFWVVGWVLTGLAGPARRTRPGVFAALMLPAFLGVWELSWVQLR